MAGASIDAISNRPYDLDLAPVEIRDTEHPLYIQCELVRDKRLWPLVEKIAEEVDVQSLPVWVYQILASIPLQNSRSLHKFVHESLFWSIYATQQSQLARPGSDTRQALVLSFGSFEGLWEAGRNPGWERFVSTFRRNLAIIIIDKDFLSYAPDGYPNCKARGPVDSEALDNRRVTFDGEFRRLDCWSRWLHRFLRAGNDNSSKAFTEYFAKAHMFRTRPDPKVYEVDYRSWPVVHSQLFTESIDYGLVDEDGDLMTDEQKEKYRKWSEKS